MAPPGLAAGWLEKRSHWVGKWKRRYFVLLDDSLVYFLEEASSLKVPRGGLHFVPGGAVKVNHKHKPYCLKVGGELLNCKDQDELDFWFDAINSACARQPIMQLMKRAQARQVPTPSKAGTLENSTPLTTAEGAAPESGSTASSSSSGPQPAISQVETTPLDPFSSPGEPQAAPAKPLVLPIQAVERPMALPQEPAAVAPETGSDGGDDVISPSGETIHNDEIQEGLAPEPPTRAPEAAPQSPPHSQGFVTPTLGPSTDTPMLGDAPAEEGPTVTGIWELVKEASDSIEPLLAAFGVPWPARKMAASAKPVVSIDLGSAAVKITQRMPLGNAVEEALPIDGSIINLSGFGGAKQRKHLVRWSRTEIETASEIVGKSGEVKEHFTLMPDGHRLIRRTEYGTIMIRREFQRQL